MPKGLSKSQAQSWDRINDMAQAAGAWVVSEPGKNPLRLECMTYDLPWRLASMNYDVKSMGTNQRLIPMVGGVGVGTVFVVQVDLPLGPVASSDIP
jgi:hypothetical protein